MGVFQWIFLQFTPDIIDKNFIRDTLINVRTGKHVRAPALPKYISKTVLRHTLKEVDVLENNSRVTRKREEAKEARKKRIAKGLTILKVTVKTPAFAEVVKFLLSLIQP